MKLFTEMDKKSDLQLKELRDKADKRLRELEILMETKYSDEVLVHFVIFSLVLLNFFLQLR
jgi:hypothetical protein